MKDVSNFPLGGCVERLRPLFYDTYVLYEASFFM